MCYPMNSQGWHHGSNGCVLYLNYLAQLEYCLVDLQFTKFCLAPKKRTWKAWSIANRHKVLMSKSINSNILLDPNSLPIPGQPFPETHVKWPVKSTTQAPGVIVMELQHLNRHNRWGQISCTQILPASKPFKPHAQNPYCTQHPCQTK